MFGASDFDIFGNIRTAGASNPTGVAMQSMSSPQTLMPVGMTNTVGFNGVQAGMTAPQIPTNTGFNGTSASTPLGFNLGTGQLILGGVQALGNLWAAWEAQKLAKEQFNFQKGVTNTNMANQIQSYNTQLTDRINARAHMEGRPEGYAQTYIEENMARDMRK